MPFLEVTFHLQSLPNDCIPHVVQNILESVLYPVVHAAHSHNPLWPLFFFFLAAWDGTRASCIECSES